MPAYASSDVGPRSNRGDEEHDPATDQETLQAEVSPDNIDVVKRMDMDIDIDSLPDAAHRLPNGDVLHCQQRALVRAAASLASYCEHVEHNEPHVVEDAARAGDSLRTIALALAREADLSLLEVYRRRIEDIEAASLHSATAIDGIVDMPGADALRHATTWRQVQIAQLLHDRRFHPDVFGLSKLEQLRHYTLHVTKLAGLLVDADEPGSWWEFAQSRLPDLAVFGVKLASVCNCALPDEAVDSARREQREPA
jgi:hypothetical protein